MPLVVDGVMYVSITWSRVIALDAATGEVRWRYDPGVDRKRARDLCCDVVNRGVALWKGAVYVGTLDGRLVSLDAATGKPNWEVLTIDPSQPYSITGAPRIVKGKVIIGNGGAERGVRGYVTAYDAATGAQVWRFYTVPGDPSKPFEHPDLEAAAATWSGEWWKVGGGGTAWDAMAFDPELDLLYIGTGNGAPWTRYERSPEGGDNLYLCAIVALRPDTGELVWYYQTTPGDNWDYTSVQHMILAELEIEGAVRKVVMQAPKNGFFYVLDRATGELISAEPYAVVNWATHIDKETGRPVETAHSNYVDEDRLILPGPAGAHNWHPMSFHPETGLVYISSLDLGFWYAHERDFEFRPLEWNLAIDLDRNVDLSEKEPPDAAGQLIAWDPVAQKEVWRVSHKGYWNGGVVSTAGGLVFQGTGDGRFAAYDAQTGAVQWEIRSQTGIMAAPVSYSVGGEQYIAVAAGWGGGAIGGGPVEEAVITQYHNEGRVLAFKLGATGVVPRSTPRDQRVPAPPPLTASPEQIRHGKTVYNRLCMFCHGPSVKGSLIVPDLRFASPEKHAAFESIVFGGMLLPNGMPSFADSISAEELPALQGYIIAEALKAYEEQQKPSD
jgi:PQQ-dependent dehydrogenase (methanol/ethanol family)